MRLCSAAPANDRELHFRSCRAREEPLPLECRHVACRPRVEQTDEIPWPNPCLCGRGIIAGGNHAQIVLMRQCNAHVGGTRLLAALPLADPRLGEMRAVSTEA